MSVKMNVHQADQSLQILKAWMLFASVAPVASPLWHADGPRLTSMVHLNKSIGDAHPTRIRLDRGPGEMDRAPPPRMNPRQRRWRMVVGLGRQVS